MRTLLLFTVLLFGALLISCSDSEEVVPTSSTTVATALTTPTPTQKPAPTPSVTSAGGWDPVCGAGCIPGQLLIYFDGATLPASVQETLDRYGAVRLPISDSLGPGQWAIEVEVEKTDDLFSALSNRQDVRVERMSSGMTQ